MANNITITVTGLDKLQAALAKFPNEIADTFKVASQEASEEILNTTGLREYPAATAANAPPVPYYVRGQGTQYASGNRGNSERLGTQFYVQAGSYSAEIGNRASYADYVVGDKQAGAMKRIGWRQLYEVAVEKQSEIALIFNRWVARLITRLGL